MRRTEKKKKKKEKKVLQHNASYYCDLLCYCEAPCSCAGADPAPSSCVRATARRRAADRPLGSRGTCWLIGTVQKAGWPYFTPKLCKLFHSGDDLLLPHTRQHDCFLLFFGLSSSGSGALGRNSGHNGRWTVPRCSCKGGTTTRVYLLLLLAVFTKLLNL